MIKNCKAVLGHFGLQDKENINLLFERNLPSYKGKIVMPFYDFCLKWASMKYCNKKAFHGLYLFASHFTNIALTKFNNKSKI
jgi:hypothetical protein